MNRISLLLFLFILATITRVNELKSLERRTSKNTTHVHLPIWIPFDMSQCQGQFRAKTKSQNASDPYALVVREASVDWRHVSIDEARQNGIRGSYRRIVILMTALPSARNRKKSELVRTIDSEEYRKSGYIKSTRSEEKLSIEVHFDYLIEDQRCQTTCGMFGKCGVREWQAIVTLVPSTGLSESKFLAKLNKLMKSNASLKIVFYVLSRSSNKIEKVQVEIALACVASLVETTQIPYLETYPRRQERCDNARGAIAIAGSPMYGNSLRGLAPSKLLAHYAARNLFGHTWFNKVIVAVHLKYSVSEIQSRCGSRNSTCVLQYQSENLESIKRTRNAMEKELSIIGVPEKDWNRILLISICNLGADFESLETHHPCEASFFGGQKVLGHFSYIAFAPYFKWASNFDIDEFLLDEFPPRQSFKSTITKLESAEQRFNRIINGTNKHSFFANWLDFVLKPSQMVSITRKVVSGQELQLKSLDPADSTFNIDDCRGGGGRSIVSCHRTLSFMNHYALQSMNGSDLSKVDCGPKRNPKRRTVIKQKELYVWHVRNPARQGRCSFKEK